MSSMLPTPTSCCDCGFPISQSTLDSFLTSNQFPFYVETYADVRALATDSTNQLVIAQGRDSAGDGYFSFWDWDNSGTDADDNSTVLRPDDYVSGGIWRRRL